MPGEPHHASVPSLHGRRTGRPLRKGQKARFDRALPDVALEASAIDDPWRQFSKPVTGLRLEIGFGAGEHLAAQAARFPQTGFIGCEPFRNGIAKMLERIETQDLRNVRLFCGDAALVLARLPATTLSGVDLLYPDPWPKRRHHKRRFVSDELLLRLAATMRPGAELRFATDIDDYAAWTLARILRSSAFAWSAERSTEWLTPWGGWPSTRYEAKALDAGRRPVYLTFIRR